ncbi:unnamed protein product [Orchesella dallaii]|uniref:Uncharacterized protein n=1 Tax=Orchesella dallaii TaxID=48710 RepID=A0ABP1QZF6_9HEXA
MKRMFPTVKQLDITGNIVVIFYTFLILEAVAFLIFVVEHLCNIRIFGLFKKKTRSDVAIHDQPSISTMQSPIKNAAFLIGPATDLKATDPSVCEMQAFQKPITNVHVDRANLGASSEGECNTHVYPIDEACAIDVAAKDGQFPPGDHLLSQQTQNYLIMSVNCDEATDTDDDSKDNGESDIRERRRKSGKGSLVNVYS